MKNKFLSFFASTASILALTGCDEVTMNNLTSNHVSENPSGIYSMELEARPENANIDPNSFETYIVIDGQMHKMDKGDSGKYSFKYDYEMPAGANRARYYYFVKYQVRNRDHVMEKEAQSNLYDIELRNRYVTSIQAPRGLVGSTISVVGRGFNQYDSVLVGGVDAPTRYVSTHEIEFTVPALDAENVYDVELNSGYSTKRIGEFRIDPSRIRMNKSRIDLKKRQRTVVVFQIDNPAPANGLELSVTTDIPDSIMMPEVVIPAGSKTVNVMLEGAQPGFGQLYVEAPGYHEMTVPVSIEESLYLEESDDFFEEA